MNKPQKEDKFPAWRNDADYVIDQYGQTALYWKSGGKRINESARLRESQPNSRHPDD